VLITVLLLSGVAGCSGHEAVEDAADNREQQPAENGEGEGSVDHVEGLLRGAWLWMTLLNPRQI
jgi:hypothetical protein